MPGVSISTAVRTGPSTASTNPAATFFVVGETARGIDTVARRVTSLEAYETAFGGYEANKYTYQQVRTFFEEGGSVAYVARATASGGVRASKALLADPSSAPGITLTAVGKGTWGNSIHVAVVNSASESFTMSIYYGAAATADTLIYTSPSFTSLSEAVTAINASTVLAEYCTAALTASADASALLTNAAAAAFTSGDNGSIAAGDFTGALARFTEEMGSGCVAIPGLADGTSDATDVYDPIKAHCVTYNRIALLSFAAGTSTSAAIAASDAYGASNDEGHEYLAFYHPWITVPYTSSTNLTVPPEGYVAAIRSKMLNQVGTWKAAAGSASSASFVNGTETAVGRSDGDSLDASYVNAIRVINNSVRIYGARSHSRDTVQWRFITQRDTINYIVDRSNNALEPLVFSPINGRKSIYSDIESALLGVLEPIRLADGFFAGFDASGKQVDPGYTIRIDDSINPLSQLETGLVRAQVGVRLSTVADKITVTLTKSNLTATLL